MSIHIHIHKARDAANSIDKAKKAIEKLVKANKDVRSPLGWVGKELKIEMRDGENAYVKFEINDADTKYRIVSTMNGFADLRGKIFDL